MTDPSSGGHSPPSLYSYSRPTLVPPPLRHSHTSPTSLVCSPLRAMAEHLIGKKIILKSNSEIRYTGTLHAIDTAGKSISLIDVLSLGTEDRVTPGGYVAPANTVYPYVVFR